MTVTEEPAVEEEPIEFARPEWRLAFLTALTGLGLRPVDRDRMRLACEVLRLWDLAEVKYELVRAEKGYDVGQDLGRRIDKLYMGLNARERYSRIVMEGGGVPMDVARDWDGDEVSPWNNMVSALATSLALALANGRWAALEHRQADALRDALLNGVDVGPLGQRPEIPEPGLRRATAWRKHVRQRVVHTFMYGEEARGEVTSANDRYVFVRFDGKPAAEACEPERLRLEAEVPRRSRWADVPTRELVDEAQRRAPTCKTHRVPMLVGPNWYACPVDGRTEDFS